ncbi:MAG: GTP-binding protein [Planctomycetaceae bacterium]|nr:GTP-binding protein [Planctomycetaceae bacterium]MCH2595556.1 DUF4416 family protein [Pirellulales bacterium]HCK42675.1 DUF4416 domain-containing protein [Planctomycetaceae bacterium]
MGEILNPTPVMLVMAVSTRYQDALTWAEERAVAEFGPLLSKSQAFDFVETNYYQATMGKELKKQFLSFQNFMDPGLLPQIKHTTNALEKLCADKMGYPETRPLNLDPGYLTLAKLVLATTKDHAHRIYMGDGIYAEVTLNYRHGCWQKCDWTYPDYQREDYQGYFTQCRQELRG